MFPRHTANESLVFHFSQTVGPGERAFRRGRWKILMMERLEAVGHVQKSSAADRQFSETPHFRFFVVPVYLFPEHHGKTQLTIKPLYDV